MGSERRYTIAINELSAYLMMDKRIDEDIYFYHYPRKSKKSPNGFHLWESTHIINKNDAVDDLKLVLKSLTMYGEWYHSFMLVFDHHGTKNIIHQLEVLADDYPSHKEGKIQLFGSHIYELGKTYETRPMGYQHFTWYDWFEFYKSCIHLTTTGKAIAPNDGELF